MNINAKQNEKRLAIIGLLTVVREGTEVRMILSTTPERETFNGRELVPEVKGRDSREDVCRLISVNVLVILESTDTRWWCWGTV